MANAFTTITKYIQKALDTVLVNESKTAILENGEKFIDLDFKEAGYVKIASVLMDGLSDYHRANHNLGSGGYTDYNGVGHNDGYAVGSVSLEWEIFHLAYDRGKQFQIDDMDNEETAGLIMGNLVTEFLRTKVVPEIDAVRFSKIASYGYPSLGNVVTETISANAIIGKFNTAFEWLSEHEVEAENQVIFVNPAVMTLIRNTTELYKRLTQGEFASERGATLKVEKYEGRPIIEVPSNRFYDLITVGANGYAPSSGSAVINFIVCDKRCIVPVVKLQKSKVYGPDVVQDFDGYKFNFHLYHDAFVPKNKIVGCYISKSQTAATTKASLLNLALAAGSVQNGLVLDSFTTSPAGMLGEIFYQTSASAITSGLAKPGDSISAGQTWTKWALVEGKGPQVTISERYAQFVLVQGGKAIATTGSIDLNGIKHA